MEHRLKHLEFIQGVVNRLSTNSFLLKGWSVVIVSALFALSAKDANPQFVLLAYVPALAFWGLDGYFLATEKAYRELYDAVRLTNENDIDFSMNIDDVSDGAKGWFRAIVSKTILPFHAPISLAIIIVYSLQCGPA